jgi:hypothetical protein
MTALWLLDYETKTVLRKPEAGTNQNDPSKCLVCFGAGKKMTLAGLSTCRRCRGSGKDPKSHL